MRISITSNLKKIILQETKKNPHLGVRGISKILKEKHQTDISKSAVNALLKAKGIKVNKGRKKDIL
ncbi:MAG: helix-turn-helix domain-containing protein, partial [Candidatus Omnitrophota bacterium]